MSSRIDRIITEAATAIGKPYGMTPEMVLQQIVLGDRRHDDAPPEVCGAVDPRDERRWCRIPAGHPPGFHNCYWQPGDAIT